MEKPSNAKWQPFKELLEAAEKFALGKPTSSQTLKLLLRKHKPDFLSLLKNQTRNADSKAEIQKHVGLSVQGNLKVINSHFIDEALIISELFDLNEAIAFDLLVTGEQQKPNYTSYSRGLVAVMLYWDGKRNLANALKTLIQCRRGKSWTLELTDDAAALVTSYTDELLDNGLTQQILKLLENIQVEAELNKLAKQKGLGDARHRRQVRDLIVEVRQTLSDCLFNFAGQSGLPKDDVIAIIDYLRQHSEVNSSGKLSTVTISILFALLYAIKSPIDLTTDEDAEEILKQSPLCEEEFMLSVHKALIDEENEWKVPGVKSCVLLAWSLLLRTISQSTLSNSFNLAMSDVLEQDEMILENALNEKVFFFLKESIVSNDTLHDEEFYLRLVHSLVTDLIINMPLKIKEMRSQGDEVARILMLHLIEGEEAPSDMRKDFQHLMELISAMYDKDPLNIELSSDFWCFTDQTYDADGTRVASRRVPQKQAILFKFVRQSGDILPPLLYIPYIHMLSALSTGPRSARAAFELLRANGGNGDGLISWDHFFLSCHRYYESLRRDKVQFDVNNPFVALQSSSLSLGVNAKSCAITPQEVEGLRAVMKLVAKIAEFDDIACLTFFEDAHWCVCGVLFGLLQCPVPVQLKGDILNVLAQLSRLTAIASGVIQACDQAQILKGHPGIDKLGNIATELEEMEARDEEFPMSRGFLSLLTSLADLPVDMLGSCYQEYIFFVVDSLYLRSLTRAYARAEEKWEVVGQCLELFNKILMQYQPRAEDFFEEKSFSKSPDDTALQQAKSSLKHPGMPLLCHVYNEGNFFKTIMEIICTCIAYFDTHTNKTSLENSLVPAAEQSLQLLLRGMQLQESFLEVLRNTGSSLMVTSLDKLLMSINPLTGKADYVITLARFIQHSSGHPCISLLAAEILSWLCSSSAHRHMVTLMINSCDQKMRQDIIHGFVDILDTAAAEEDEGSEPNLVAQEREAIVRMLLQCVDQPSPNFTQILLGFDPMKPANSGSLQDPGVLGASRSCLHSILSILSTEDEQPAAIRESPKLAELCFHLVYRLAANPETSEPVLRYLRSSCDFIFKHLQHLPFQTVGVTNTVLMMQSWLLKTTAIELHVLASKQQRTNVQRMIQALLSTQQILNETAPLIGQSFNQSDRSRLGDVSSLQATSFINSTIKPATASKLTMLELFELVDFRQEFPPPLTLEQFVLSLVEEGIRSCESTNEHGVVFCDIKMLHHLLESSISTLATEDVNRKRLASQDVQNILRTVVQRNQVRASVHAKLHFLTSWKQVLEIMMTSCHDDVLMKASRQQVVFAILQHLVTVGRDVDTAQDLTSSLAPVVLTLAVQIRASVAAGKESGFNSDEDFPQDTANLLLTFQVVIQGVIEWLLQSGVNQKARVSLYAALLHYLQLCQQTKNISADAAELTRLQSIRSNIYTRLMGENVRMFRDFGDPFKTLVCKDAFTGHGICRVLAFACLDAILQIDNEQLWLQYMLNNGYISNMANSFSEEDQALQEFLHPASLPSRAVYIFEQKMALLCSIVNTPGGARAIIVSQILPELAKCDFLEMRPPAEYAADPASITALTRYRQLLFPVLQLCVSLLNALGGSTHHECCAVVLQFILSHAQPIVTAVLRSNASDQQSLTELRLVTGILSQVASRDFTNTALYPDIPQAILMEIQGNLLRIQRQLMHILPNFVLTDEVIKNLKSKSEEKDFEKTSLLLHEIASNLFTYCRVAVTRSADAESAIFFAPELAESSFGTPAYGNEISRKPSMGILMKFLRVALNRYNSESETLKQLQHKLDNINQLSSQELKEILGPDVDVVQLSVDQEQNLAVTKINHSIAIKKKLTKCLLYILETNLFLLWHHLSIYVNQAITVGKTKEKILFPVKTMPMARSSPRRLQDISNANVREVPTITKLELPPVNINQLKSDFQACFADSFLKKLSAVEREGSFIQPLVRRMQCVKLQLN